VDGSYCGTSSCRTSLRRTVHCHARVSLENCHGGAFLCCAHLVCKWRPCSMVELRPTGQYGSHRLAAWLWSWSSACSAETVICSPRGGDPLLVMRQKSAGSLRGGSHRLAAQRRPSARPAARRHPGEQETSLTRNRFCFPAAFPGSQVLGFAVPGRP
jgi:hypothetical protein